MWFENPFRSNDPDNLVLLLKNLGAKQVRFSRFQINNLLFILEVLLNA